MVDLSKLPPEILNTYPLLPPPPGITSNFAHPAQNRTGLRLAIYITLPIAIISVIMRLHTRAKVSGGIGADDLMSDLLGLHLWDIPIRRLNVPFLKSVIASLGLYALGAILVKVCLLSLYLRLFNINHNARVVIWGAIVFIALLYITTTSAMVKFYLPPKGDWISLRSASTTNALNNITAVQGIAGAATDFYILFIPLFFISRLHLPLRRKIGVCAIFLSGLIIVELNVGIICSCMPVVFVVLKSVLSGDSFFTRLIYYRSRHSKSTIKGAGQPDPDPYNLEQGGFDNNALPAVPRAAMIGVRSFTWKGTRSKPIHGDSGISSYHELTSLHNDYH
ncbi:hypothetical protein B0O99DRAFT_528540 [Bisporella sp. PMI_857]|nr:hypothetical protein B0O99DRAFT_528540 [Bisporella sp. PMI_857]